jgi:hypothetical protein
MADPRGDRKGARSLFDLIGFASSNVASRWGGGQDARETTTTRTRERRGCPCGRGLVEGGERRRRVLLCVPAAVERGASSSSGAPLRFARSLARQPSCVSLPAPPLAPSSTANKTKLSPSTPYISLSLPCENQSRLNS